VGHDAGIGRETTRLARPLAGGKELEYGYVGIGHCWATQIFGQLRAKQQLTPGVSTDSFGCEMTMQLPTGKIGHFLVNAGAVVHTDADVCMHARGSSLSTRSNYV